MTLHSTSQLTPVLALALSLVGCWDGASSQGLPCDDSRHCGVGIECINGFCGGEPSDALCGNGFVDHGEACDNGAENAADGRCRPDCTPQLCGDGVQGPDEACDEGAQNNDQGACKSDCTVASCGDGEVGPGETCDDGGTVAGDGCSPTCLLESCGNGIVDPEEDCDDGEESPSCDDDCTEVLCGDLNINEAAGEACDNESPAADDYDCLSNCKAPILWDDMEPDTPQVTWTHEKLSGDLAVVDNWLVTPRNPEGGSMRAWDSGVPAPTSGDTRLLTPALELAGLEGESVQLRFDHARRFLDCNEPTVAYEGAIVEVSADGGPFETITPNDDYTGTIGSGMCNDPLIPNPLEGAEGFTLDTDYTTEIFDLSAYVGSTIVIGFRVGWDCGNCDEVEQLDRGWFIDNVAVSLQ